MKKDALHIPLVSVVIPCYNHGQYLSEAIESIRNQSYPHIEIIVVDDGSTDDTKAVASKYPEVRYIFQKNLGLSAARNTGTLQSKGNFLIFLDADDLLFPYSVAHNIEFMQQNPDAAFVSGASQITTIDRKEIGEKKVEVTFNHYQNLLRSNYIGMHATVMYKRYVFQEFQFDVALKSCEDYDLYLRIARKYPVAHHTKRVAMYRMHSSNMSGNILIMLKSVLAVLSRQEACLASDAEKKAYKEGVKSYKKYYTIHLYHQLIKGKIRPDDKVETLALLKSFNPKIYFRYQLMHMLMKIENAVMAKKNIPTFSLRLLHKLGLYKKFIPTLGNVKKGDFYRTTPFSTCFGYDRGGPIDRYYIEGFLQAEAASIRGRVLEIGDNEYTLRYGGTNVEKSEILHVDETNPQATIVGDLSNVPQIPDNSFDCIILTQTLHLVYDYKAVIQTCFRILKRGGSLLLTVPGITPIDYGEWGNRWLWSFTGRVMEKILEENFPGKITEINTYGNVYVASAFLYGMGLPELSKEVLDVHDPQMQVIITAKVVK